MKNIKRIISFVLIICCVFSIAYSLWVAIVNNMFTLNDRYAPNQMHVFLALPFVGVAFLIFFIIQLIKKNDDTPSYNSGRSGLVVFLAGEAIILSVIVVLLCTIYPWHSLWQYLALSSDVILPCLFGFELFLLPFRYRFVFGQRKIRWKLILVMVWYAIGSAFLQISFLAAPYLLATTIDPAGFWGDKAVQGIVMGLTYFLIVAMPLSLSFLASRYGHLFLPLEKER